MTTSHIPATIDALMSVWAAASLKVWDGPVVTQDFSPAVFVGYDGDPDGDFKAVVGTQDWAGLGARKRSEEFTVICAAIALSGNDDVKSCRDLLYSMLDIAGSTLRANPSLGFDPPFVAQLRPNELFIWPTDAGYVGRWVFSVDTTISRV